MLLSNLCLIFLIILVVAFKVIVQKQNLIPMLVFAIYADVVTSAILYNTQTSKIRKIEY